jgi:plasmid stabilization system protein ParE
MAKRVVYTDKAYVDIDRIIEFNNHRNKSKTYSRKFLTGLKRRLLELSKQPYSGRKVDEPDTLLLIWDNYYVFYVPNETYIEITSIYHQKENVKVT